MKRDFSFSPLSGFFAGLVFLLLSFTPVAAQELSIPANDVYTVEDDGSPEEYTKVTINQNSHLIVEGTLIVFGNLDMQANDSQITFKDGSVVIVYGNFIAGNKVSISAHSHFIVYGDFIRQQGNTQHAGVDFTNGNIYIFGDVDDSFNIDDCDIGNDGDAKDDGSCEYRTEEDFKEDELDPELQEALNCYKIHDIQNVTACENQSAIFEAVFIASAPETVVYQWQKKQEGGIWENLNGETGSTLTVDSIDISMDGAEYRLVLSGGTCDVSISNTATLEVTGPVVIGEITGLTEVCGKGPFTYTLAEAQAATDYSWQVPLGWKTPITGSVV